MALTEKYVTTTGTDTYANASNSGTPCSFATALTGATAGHRINVKAGTYANTTTNRATAAAGTTTAPILWRGYNATIGDIEADPTLARPVISFTTGQFQLAHGLQTWSCIDFTGAPTATGVMSVTASVDAAHFDLCRFENTSANAGATSIISTNSSRLVFTRCGFKATSSANTVIDFSGMTATPKMLFAECAFVGGGDGVRIAPTGASGTGYTFVKNAFRVAAVGVSDAGTVGFCHVLCNSFYGGTDHYRASAARSGAGQVVLFGNVSGNSGGYGFHNNTGANTAYIFRVANHFGLYTSGKENGFGDLPALAQTDDGATTPFASATDLTLAPAALGRATLNVGAWPDEAFAGYADRGAVQHADSGGGAASMMRPVGTNGGLV